MSKLKALLAAAATCAVCLVASAGSKYAILVGVDKNEPKYAADSGLKDRELSGSKVDVQNMREVLTRYGGWSADSVVELRDENATLENVHAAFRDIAARIKGGDSFVLYWAGHGGYTYNPKTGKESAEVCAYDGDYSDAMLAEDLGNLPSGVKAVVVIDTCCSGALVQMTKVGGNAKAASATFAQRVDALLARSKAGGIAASEVGWMSSVAYNQETDDSIEGGDYMSKCLAPDGVYWGKADTDEDGDISFLDLHIHARKWFSENAWMAREEAICGKLSEQQEKDIKLKARTISPQVLHEDVLASVLARDHAVAGGAKYPFKVEFHLLCGNEKADEHYASISNNAVQFVWPGESAVEPTLDIVSEVFVFEGWDTEFTDVREDLIVRGSCVDVRDPDGTTFETVAEKVKKFMGYTLCGVEDSETNQYEYVGATFEGVYAKGGNLTVTLTDIDGTKTKFKGALEDMPINGYYWAELTTSKSDDMLEIRMNASSVIGTYTKGDEKFTVQGNWDWLATRDTSALAVCKKFGAVYNVGMDVKFIFDGREELPSSGGYLNVTISEKDGKAKVAGVLADGTKVSVLTRALLLTTPELVLSDYSQGVCVPIVFARTNKRSGFSGLLKAYFDAENGGLKAVLKNACWDNPARGEAAAYQAYLFGEGSEFLADEMPETAATEISGDVPPLYVKVGGQYVALPCETNVLYSGHALAYANGKFKVTDPQPDKAKLKLTMNKRTGVISGSFRVWYADDPEDPSVEKYVTATVYGGWESSGNKASAFGLVTDTHPDRAKLKLKVPVKLVIGEPAASDEADED